MSLFARTDRSFLGRWWWTIDRALLVCFILLAVIGVLMVATASPSVAERNEDGPYHFLIRHIIFLVPALMAMIGVSMMKPRGVWRLGSVLYGISLIGLVIVLFAGIEVKGAQRWLRVFDFSVQPSEFAKTSFAIVSAWFMAKEKEKK